MSLENCESDENPKLRQVGALHKGNRIYFGNRSETEHVDGSELLPSRCLSPPLRTPPNKPPAPAVTRNTEHKACPQRSLYGVLRLVGALDFTGGVGRENYR